MSRSYQDTDAAWEMFGKTEPYFGVAALDKFRQANLTAETRDEFFRTGDEYFNWLLDIVRTRLVESFNPGRCLDFGCGVGRILLPMAARFASVVGVDVSDSMLAEAAKNCAARNLRNVALVKSDDLLSRVSGQFDFIHSVIVFQHIPAARGLEITRRLIGLLEAGGVGALHYIYDQELTLRQRILLACYRYIPLAYAARCALKRRRLPVMQMNVYNLNSLFRLFHDHDCHSIYLQFTKADCRGALFFFQKRRQIKY